MEFIPPSSWGLSGSNLCSRKKWQSLKRRLAREQENRCRYCQRNAELELHETWDYLAAIRVQRLVKVSGICRDCHQCVHWGRTLLHSTQERLKYLTEHFIWVNKCTFTEMVGEFKRAKDDYHARKNTLWEVDLGLLRQANI